MQVKHVCEMCVWWEGRGVFRMFLLGGKGWKLGIWDEFVEDVDDAGWTFELCRFSVEPCSGGAAQ